MKENNLPNPPFPVDVDAWRLWLDLGRRDAAAADKLYFDHFLTAHIAYLRTKSDPTRGASSLVTLIGFSPMVSAIVAGLLRPSSVVAIGGAEAAPSVALLRGFLSSGAGGFVAQLEYPAVSADDHRGVFKIVSKALREDSEAVVDITGGKKIMTAAAAQAAWEFDRPACYLEAKNYIPELRRPLPGNEELIFLPSRSSLLENDPSYAPR
jgi:hypothetical protein